MKIRRRRSCFLRNASNPSWNRRPGTTECPFSRLRISLLKRIPSINVRTADGELMGKKTILLVNLFAFMILFFPHPVSYSQNPQDRRFPKDVAQSPLPKLLDFGRGICIPCKKMAPILQELSEEYKGSVIIKIIEIDREKELTQLNKIRLIPTQIFFDSKNKEVFRHEGFMDKEAIKKIFQQMGINPVSKPSTL
jgi:thioredoxin 1